jgi:hypothetical protein
LNFTNPRAPTISAVTVNITNILFAMISLYLSVDVRLNDL